MVPWWGLQGRHSWAEENQSRAQRLWDVVRTRQWIQALSFVIDMTLFYVFVLSFLGLGYWGVCLSRCIIPIEIIQPLFYCYIVTTSRCTFRCFNEIRAIHDYGQPAGLVWLMGHIIISRGRPVIPLPRCCTLLYSPGLCKRWFGSLGMIYMAFQPTPSAKCIDLVNLNRSSMANIPINISICKYVNICMNKNSIVVSAIEFR